MTHPSRRPIPRLPRWPLAALAALALFLAAGRAAVADGMVFGNGLLWRIERAGAAPSHVFGTLHLTDDRVTALAAPVKRAFAAARSLTLEILPDKDLPVRMARAMVLPEGRRLETMVGPELFARSVAAAARSGIPPQAVARLKPWAVAAAISIPPSERARQASGKLALDMALGRAAKSRGMAMYALETVEHQLALFDGIDEADQVAMLRHAVDDAPDIEALVGRMTEFYLARDIGGLMGWMTRQGAGKAPRLLQIFQSRLIDARNRTMVETMRARLDEGAAFIAIGAAHLPGENGVLNRLAARGYRITRIY